MLKESSENQSFQERCPSDELHFDKKYSRKTKNIKKKSSQISMLSNKKKRCPLFDKGICPNGAMCSFTHSFIPDIAKKQCKLFSVNLCKKGEWCPYSHNPSRFSCKSLFILGKCMKGQFCPFSHEPLDPDFQQDFFEDNLDFITDALKEKKQLSQKCLEYTKTTDVIAKRKKQAELQQQNRFPLYFGLALTRSNSVKGSNHDSAQKQKIVKRAYTKRQLKSQKPFSIRLSSKNREQIPESIYLPNNLNKMIEPIQQENQLWQSRVDENIMKLPQCIELTPQQRGYHTQGNQNLFNQSPN